jgi:hypothetical protein
MKFEQTLAAIARNTAVATAIAPMETTSPAGSKRAATGGRGTKAKAPKKVLMNEEKDIEATK